MQDSVLHRKMPWAGPTRAPAAITEGARLSTALAVRRTGRFTDHLRRAIGNLHIDLRDLGRTDALVREITATVQNGPGGDR